jgi:hypothetical protein
MTMLLAMMADGGLEGLLFKVAVGCVIIWAIYALIQWMGWTIPRPVQIVFIALACILCIYWGFEIFHALQ